MSSRKVLKGKSKRAVSPVVATLILIIVAIVGAITVGLIMSGIGSQTAKQANANNAQSQASTQIFVYSSASSYSVMSQLASNFETANPDVSIVVEPTGSAAAMQGLNLGVADIGVSADLGTFTNAQSLYPSANLLATEMGAGYEVVIMHGSTSSNGGFLQDGSGNSCEGITQAALQAIYSYGTFYLGPTSCASYFTLDQPSGPPGVFSSAQTGGSGPFTAYVGPDEASPSGTVAKYLAEKPTGTQENTEGNLEAAVAGQKNSIAFIEGSANINGGSVTLAEPQIDTLSPSLYPSIELPAGSSAANQEANILAALTSNSNTQWPDNAAVTSGAAPGNLLTNHFQIVTSGQPDAIVQKFIQFVEGPNSQATFTNNALFSIYQYSSLAGTIQPLIVFSADSYVAESQTMESAFNLATGTPMAPPFGAGSSTLATDIRGGAPVSVFMSISKTAIGDMATGIGAYSPGWAAAVATDQMVIAYSPITSNAVQNNLVSEGTSASTNAQWATFFNGLVSTPGIKVGIANPDNDPAGYRGWLVLELADATYLSSLTPPQTDSPACTPNPATCAYLEGGTLPSGDTVWGPYFATTLYGGGTGANYATGAHAAAMVGQLQTGVINFLFMYKSLAVLSNLNYISLPSAINLGSSSPPLAYKYVAYVSSTGTTTQTGGLIELFLTVPTDSTNTAASDNYVQYVISNYKTLLASYSVVPLSAPTLFEESASVSVPTGIYNAVTAYSGYTITTGSF